LDKVLTKPSSRRAIPHLLASSTFTISHNSLANWLGSRSQNLSARLRPRQPMALLENMLISFLRYDMSARGAVIKTNSCPRVMTRIKQIVFRS
jgi:hypothetical protein